MSGKSAARRSRRARSDSQITEACWKSDFDDAREGSGEDKAHDGVRHRPVAVQRRWVRRVSTLADPRFLLGLAPEIAPKVALKIDRVAVAGLRALIGKVSSSAVDYSLAVFPAKAGTQSAFSRMGSGSMGPGFRRDEQPFGMVQPTAGFTLQLTLAFPGARPMPDTLTTNSPINAAYRAATPGSAAKAPRGGGDVSVSRDHARFALYRTLRPLHHARSEGRGNGTSMADATSIISAGKARCCSATAIRT